MTHESWHFEVRPQDAYNQELLKSVHPADWTPPKPEPKYNLVVIGAGTAGLIAALGCAALGGKAALVERHLMGGDCLNVGCVPSKSLIRSSRLAAEMAVAGRFGLSSHPAAASDFATVMARVRRLRVQISHHDTARRCSAMGVHVFLGEARFVDPHRVRVAEKMLHFRKAVIAAGARAVHPDIPGLADAGYLTNETVFNLTQLPPRLAVVGGGPIGCELAQAFRRFGSEVNIIENTRFLPREDNDASTLLARVFEREGIRVWLATRLIRVAKGATGKHLIVQTGQGQKTFEADEILVGVGRRPNVEGLDLERAAIVYDAHRGVRVDDYLRTSNPDIYAAGDICMAWKFTHAADAAARIAIQNALFKGKKRLSRLTMPWCTYTDPEIAHVGMYESEVRARDMAVDIYKVDLMDVDRAVLDGQSDGFVKILVKKGTDRILGATVVAAHAGDLISEISLAMAANAGLKIIGGVIHPYPTQAEAIKRVADLYNRTRLTPRIAKLFKWWLKWQRR